MQSVYHTRQYRGFPNMEDITNMFQNSIKKLPTGYDKLSETAKIYFSPKTIYRKSVKNYKDTINYLKECWTDFSKDTAYLRWYTRYVKFVVEPIIAFIKYMKKHSISFIKNKYTRYSKTHLTKIGNNNIIISMGIGNFVSNNGRLSTPKGDQYKIINNYIRHGGILLYNTLGSLPNAYNMSERITSSKKVCFASNNGAYIQVINRKGAAVVLKEEKLPLEAVEAIGKIITSNDILKNNYAILIEDRFGAYLFDPNPNSNLKLKNVKTKYDTSQNGLTTATKNAYSIRIVPKVDSVDEKRRKINYTNDAQKLETEAMYLDALLGKALKEISKADPKLLKIMDENTEMNFGHNAITISKKGCSKTKADEIVAKYYGLERTDVLKIANTRADISDNTSFGALKDLENVPDENVIRTLNNFDPFYLFHNDNMQIFLQDKNEGSENLKRDYWDYLEKQNAHQVDYVRKTKVEEVLKGINAQFVDDLKPLLDKKELLEKSNDADKGIRINLIESEIKTLQDKRENDELEIRKKAQEIDFKCFDYKMYSCFYPINLEQKIVKLTTQQPSKSTFNIQTKRFNYKLSNKSPSKC